MTRNGWPIVVLAAAALAALACGMGSSSSSGSLSVSVRSGATAPAMAGSLDLGNGIQLSEIRLAVIKVALESGKDATDASDTHASAAPRALDDGGGRGGGGGGDGGGQGESDEVRVGPCLVDLTGSALSGRGNSISPVCAADVPAGTYQELEVDVGPVAAGAEAGVAGLAGMDGESVIVDGTFGGTSFSFRSTLEVRQKTEAVITVGTSNNVTISLDPTGWFTAPDGGVLDPTLAANQSAIEGNIRASIRSFEDDNRDGQEDGGDHGGGSGDG